MNVALADEAPDDVGDAQVIAAAAMARLRFRRPWSMEEFIADLSIDLGKPVVVDDLSATMSRKLTGIWIPTPVQNLVLVQQGSQGPYREHLISHEVAHIVLAHQPTPELMAELRHAYFQRHAPDLPIGMLELLSDTQPCLARRIGDDSATPASNFRHPVERQAEWLATMIMDRANQLREPLFPEDLPERDKAMLSRAAAVFGWQQ